MLTDQLQLSILARSGDATAIYDSPELHISFANEAMLRIWGKNREVMGKTFEEVLPEVKGQPFTNLLKDVWRSGGAYSGIDTPATLEVNGELKTSYFDFEYQAIRNDIGEVIAILHTARDVTSEVLSNNNITQLNLRLSESLNDFKRMVQQAPVAILVFRGAEMIIEQVNEAMLEILGKDDRVIGKPLLEGLPEIKGAPTVDMLFEVFHTGKALDGNEEPVPIKRNGKVETRYFNFSYRPLIDEGKIIGVMDVAVEVTEQVLARKHLENIIFEKTGLEQDLRANEQRLQGILDTMAEGVVIADAYGTPTYANPMAQRIIGQREQEFLSRNYNDRMWQNERLDGSPLPWEEHPLYLVLHSGRPIYDQEIAVTLPSSEKIYISINAAPLLDEQQVVTGAIVTFADVTTRRRVLQEKEDFISVASHELKTPVTSLKASLQLLERMQNNVRPDMLSKLVTQANKSLHKLSELVNSLLNSNRISQGRFPINKTTFLASDLINDCCQHIRAAGTHNILFEGEPDLIIHADEQLIDQVVVNLVNNAVKYAPGSRDIVIRAEKQDNAVRVSVTDKGPGIPQEKTRHIFERYYQAEHDGPQFSGLGLGLYISAEIVHKHGGEIGVDSTPGQGSTFWFTLPSN